MTDQGCVAFLEAEIARLRDRCAQLERQAGALRADKDRSVQAALDTAESCEEHGRMLMHWRRLAEWHWAAANQQECARFAIVAALCLASSGRDLEVRRDGETVRVPVPAELATWLGKVTGAQNKVKRRPGGWPELETFLHLGCACSTVPTDGSACHAAQAGQGALFGEVA